LDNWNRLVSLTYGGEILRTEIMDQNTMVREYEKVKHLRPKFKINKEKRGDPDKYSITISDLKLD
jgi:hypothetical protein